MRRGWAEEGRERLVNITHLSSANFAESVHRENSEMGLRSEVQKLSRTFYPRILYLMATANRSRNPVQNVCVYLRLTERESTLS